MTARPTTYREPAALLAADVVAGLVNDGTAHTVARAAVREGIRRGSRVRFVQVLRTGLSSEDRAEADRATFRAALRALNGQTRVPCTFEVVEGEPGEVLVERSHDASVLVVGKDHARADAQVAHYCQQYAECDVLTVSDET